jgi:hypothetical protein
MVLTAYSIRASFYAIHELMRETMRGAGGVVESGELILRESGKSDPDACRALSTSLYSRWLPHDRQASSSRRGRVGQVKEITSLSNPVIKDIRALSMKKHRDETGTFLAEGLKLVIDAIDQGWNIRTLIYAKAQRGKPQVEKIAALTVARGGLVLEVSEKVLTAITRRDNPQAVIAVFDQKLTTPTGPHHNPMKHGSRSTGFAIRAIWAPSSAPQTRPVLPA